MSTTESLIAHLIELRTRLLHSVIVLLLIFVCLFPWASDLYALLAQPLLAKLPKGGQMIATDVITPFIVPLKVALMTAFLIALPYLLYQVWRFVAPGLYAHEKRLVVPLIAASVTGPLPPRWVRSTIAVTAKRPLVVRRILFLSSECQTYSLKPSQQ